MAVVPRATFASGLFVTLTVLSFIVTIGATYYLCAFTTLQGNPHCQNGITHLPVISFTWESAPGSWLSRWCVGMFCGCLGVCQFFIYWINGGSHRRSKFTTCGNELLLVMALTAVFCLSWVGAICDSTVPSCRGNNTIHSMFAVAFFVLYDLYMMLLHCNVPTGRHPFRTFKMVVSIATKARWFLQLPFLQGAMDVSDLDLNLVEAIFEWTNVSVIMLWTGHYVLSHPISATLSWAIIQGPKNELQSAGVLSYMSCRMLANAVVLLYVGCLVLSYIAGVHQGTLPMDRAPFISDMWVYPPGNWLSRWAVVQGVHAGVWCQTFLFFAQGGSSASMINKLGWVVSVCALVGLSVVGCVNEDENWTIHLMAASVYFGGYDFYMLTQVLFGAPSNTKATSSSSRKSWRVVMVLSMVIAFVCQAIRYCGKLHLCQHTAGLGGNAPEIAEWLDAIAIITFMYADVYSKDATKEYFLGVVQSGGQQGRSRVRSRGISKTEAAGDLEITLLTGEM